MSSLAGTSIVTGNVREASRQDSASASLCLLTQEAVNLTEVDGAHHQMDFSMFGLRKLTLGLGANAPVGRRGNRSRVAEIAG